MLKKGEYELLNCIHESSLYSSHHNIINKQFTQILSLKRVARIIKVSYNALDLVERSRMP